MMNYYMAEQAAKDRLNEAREMAAQARLVAMASPAPEPLRVVVGLALIRLGRSLAGQAPSELAPRDARLPRAFHGARVVPHSARLGASGQPEERGARARAAHDPDPAPDLDGRAQAGHAAAHRAPARGLSPDQPQYRARALADLERDGYLESQQGRGTFVADRPTREGRAARSLERLVGESCSIARGGWASPRRSSLAALASSGPTERAASPHGSARCSSSAITRSSARYREQLEEELPLQVDRMLVDEFEAKVARDPGFLKGYRVVVTTFFHIHEVKRASAAGRAARGGAPRRGQHLDAPAPHRAARGHHGRPGLHHARRAARTSSAPSSPPGSCT